MTGAGSGINQCFAALLLENGCNVLFADLSLRPEASRLVSEHQQLPGARAVFLKTDVRSWTDLSRMFEVAMEQFGSVDLVCPGAGVFEPSWSNFWLPPGGKESSDKVDANTYATMDINLTHPIRTTQLAIGHFLSGGGGLSGGKPASPENPKTIIHISSAAGQATPLPNPMYNAAKHAINGFVRTLAPLEQKLGIRIAAVAPGIIKTPLWTEHPDKLRATSEDTVWVTPEEVATVMLALVQQDSISSRFDGGLPAVQISIRGGSILEIARGTVRDVKAYNDSGPQDVPGIRLENLESMETEIIEKLRTRMSLRD